MQVPSGWRSQGTPIPSLLLPTSFGCCLLRREQWAQPVRKAHLELWAQLELRALSDLQALLALPELQAPSDLKALLGQRELQLPPDLQALRAPLVLRAQPPPRARTASATLTLRGILVPLYC